MDWLIENYAPPQEAIDPEKYKNWKKTIFSVKGADNCIDPGFPRWIGPAGPKAAETLAKPSIPSFTPRVRQASAT
jgi:hypothetical protein